MKKLLLTLTLLTSVISHSQNKQYYIEVNGGVTTTINSEDEVVDITDMSVTYEDNTKPTVSLLFGTNIPMGDFSLIDLQIGFTYPYIVSGKIGVGSYFGDKEFIGFIMGVRPYPLSVYSQLNIRQNNNLHFVLCGELGTGADVSLGVTNSINVGLRIPLLK
jgi:hypothetical protein